MRFRFFPMSVTLGAVAVLVLSWGQVPVFAGSLPDRTEGMVSLAAKTEAERDDLRRAVSVMVDSHFSGEAVSDFLEMAKELSTAGIGVGDICSKVKEGVAKKVDHQRVMAALGERVGRLKDGRALVLDLTAEGTVFLDQQMAVQVAADYLARGIPPGELRKHVASRSLGEFPALDNVIQ